jgi:hypothetical protein
MNLSGLCILFVLNNTHCVMKKVTVKKDFFFNIKRNYVLKKNNDNENNINGGRNANICS